MHQTRESAAVGLCFAALLMAGIAVSQPRPSVVANSGRQAVYALDDAWDINDISIPLADRLRELPGVERVDVPVAVDNPKHRIVHILNRHYVSPGDYASDIRDLSDEPISDDEMDHFYIDFLVEIIELQKGQRELLARLIDDHGLEAVYMEGWTIQDAELFRLIAGTLWRMEDSTPDVDADLLGLENPLAFRRLEFGVPARLWATGKLTAILPVEDHDLLEAANPIGDDGQYREVDDKTYEARENFMVRTMLKRGGVSVIVLGGGHDLGDNVRRIGKGECEYLRAVMP